MQALLTEAATNATKAVVTLQLNYIKTPIMAVLFPMLTDALKDGLEDAKAEVKAASAAGAEVKEEEVKVVVEGPRGRKPLHERLAKDEKEACPDTNILHLESCPTQYAWIGPQWTGYQMYTIKFGTQPESKLFYSVGYQYTLRHRNMRELDTRLRTEFKDDKEALALLPPLPDDCLHGVMCLCITRTVDAYGQHGRFKNYMAALQQKPFVHSKSAAELFRIGDDYEAQRRLKEVFDKAVTDTVEELLGRPACKWCEFKDPFDETEAVRQLLYLTGTPTTQRLRGMINPPFCVYNARQAAENVLLGQLEVAANSWSGGQEALNKLKKEALAAVTEGGERLVEALKPHLIKVLTLVQSKVDGKKEEKKGEEEKKEEKKEVKIGDTTFNWHFSQTGVGARLLTAMHGGSAADAIRASESDLNPRTVLERGVADVATALGAGGAQDAPGIGPVIRDLQREIYNQLYRFNTLAPLLSAARSLAEVRDGAEAALKGAATDPAKIAAAIDAQSQQLWDKGLGGAVLKMFASYQSIRAQVQSAYADPVPEEAATAMIDFCDYLYDSHVRALNSLRVRYIQLLRAALSTPEGIASADLVAEHSKKCFAQAFFEIADILMDDFWMAACDKIIVYACATAFAAFKKSVWPELAEMLGAIKSVLPDPIAKANVHEAIVLALVQTVIKKAMTALVTKMLVFAESKIYDQSS